MATSRLGLRLAPLLLRLGLGFTFLWAGLGKFAALDAVSGEDAAILANMGVIQPIPPAAAAPNHPLLQAASFRQAGAPPVATPAPATFKTYLASDFPAPIKTMRVNTLALSVYKAAHPAPRDDGSEPMLLWPPKAAEGKLPVYFAWTAGLSELIGGSFLLLGFLARLSALFVSGTMVGALWLAQIGPALQNGQTRWGFLPMRDLYAVGGSDSYVYLLWPFMLLMAGLSVVLLGAGTLSVDAVLFGPTKAPPPPPRPAPPKPAA